MTKLPKYIRNLKKKRRLRELKLAKRAARKVKHPRLTINFSEEEKLEAFHQWLLNGGSMLIAQPELKHLAFWKKAHRNKVKGELPPVRLAFIVPSCMYGHVNICYNYSGLSAELKKIMLKIGQEYLVEQAQGKQYKIPMERSVLGPKDAYTNDSEFIL